MYSKLQISSSWLWLNKISKNHGQRDVTAGFILILRLLSLILYEFND